MTKISNIKQGTDIRAKPDANVSGYAMERFLRVRAVCDDSFTVRFDSFKVMVGSLEKQGNLLLRNKQKSEVDVLFDEPFCGIHREPVADDALREEIRQKS